MSDDAPPSALLRRLVDMEERIAALELLAGYYIRATDQAERRSGALLNGDRIDAFLSARIEVPLGSEDLRALRGARALLRRYRRGSVPDGPEPLTTLLYPDDD